MKAIHRSSVLSLFLVAAYLLAACRSDQTINARKASPRFDMSTRSGLSIAQPAANIFRAAKAITVQGFNVHGINYSLVSFGDVGGVLLVGDQARLRGMITKDGEFIDREIKKSEDSFVDQSSGSGSTNDHTRSRADHANHDHSHYYSNDDCHGGRNDGHHGSPGR